MVTTTTVPGLRPVAINGISFLVDDGPGRGVKRRSVPFLRNQADTGDQPGAHSLNPAGVWRRHESDWSHGAGQSVRDSDDSDRRRFRSSKGVNPWDRWKLTLLNEVYAAAAIPASANPPAQWALTVGDYLYAYSNGEIYHTQSLSTWTAAGYKAGEAGGQMQDLTTDGFNVWFADSVLGVHTTTRGATTSTHYNDLLATRIGYVAGRLMASSGRSIYNITAGGAAPAALYTHANLDWGWQGFAAGPTHIYAAGYSGSYSAIYKITIAADGTALGTPTLAATLPYGEFAVEIFGYLGYIVIGLDRGVRLAEIRDDGNLTLGSRIPTPREVRCFGAYDRFVWFGWGFYDGTSSGLGRLDLTEFTAPLTPAYASDLMATDQRDIEYIARWGGRTIFTTNINLYYESLTEKVENGTLDSGELTFGITDDKVATVVDVAHQPLVGSHGVSLSANNGAFVSLGTHVAGGSEAPFLANESKGERHEVRHTLTRGAGGGPTVSRSTLSAYPTPRRPSEVYIVWLILHTAESLNNGYSPSRDPEALLNDIVALEEAGTVIDFQLGSATMRALIEDHEFESTGEPYGAWPQGSVGLTVRAI